MNEVAQEEFDALWCRVVADEASAEELRAVVAECELAPQRYRDLALAILEHRKLALLLASVESGAGDAVAKGPPRRLSWLETTNILIPWAVAVCMTVVAASLAFSRGDQSQSNLGAPGMAAVENTMPREASDPRLVRVDGAQESFRDWVSPMAEPVIPRELKTTIRSLGWEVRERANIYVLEDETGTQYAIPDRDFEFYFVTEQ